MKKTKPKIWKYALLGAGLGMVFLVLAFIIFAVIFFSPDQKAIDTSLQNIWDADNELTGAFDEIAQLRTILSYNQILSPEAVDKAKNDIAKLEEKLVFSQEKIERVKTELENLKKLDQNKIYPDFINLYSEAYQEYESYVNSLQQTINKFEKVMNYQNNFLEFYSQLEEVVQLEQSVTFYLTVSDYRQAKESLSLMESKIPEAKKPLLAAEKNIPFGFIGKFKTMMDYYGQYAANLKQAIIYEEEGKFSSSNESVSTAFDYAAKIAKTVPTETAIYSEVDKWFNENISPLTEAADSHLTKGNRKFDQAMAIYNTI